MIIFDPDLESDQSSKRSAAPTSRAQSRDNRIPSARALAQFLRDAQSAVKMPEQVSVLLTTDKAIRKLNRRFRAKDRATDVLSFPAYTHVSRGKRKSEEIAGDLAISVDTARKQAAAIGHSVSTEIKVLMLHGLLHLAGYDHETDDGEMARVEERLRTKLRLPRGLIERVEDAGSPSSSTPTRSAKNGRYARVQRSDQRSVQA